MALWGNNDNVGSAGTVSLNYDTRVVTGTGTSFGISGEGASEGDVIRFGIRGAGVYFGDAVIASIASSTSVTIASTMGLSGAAIAGTDFSVSQLPKSSVLDYHYSESETANHDFDSLVYGLSTTDAENTGYDVEYSKQDAGWVGVTTYLDNLGNLRVKREVLVAMSGITTGGIAYPTPE